MENEIFYEKKGITIINNDVLKTTRIEPESIDLVITSPPYNVDIKYNSHNDKLSYSDYLRFSRRWMKRCYEWLKPDGRFCLNIPLDKNKGGQQSVGADLTHIAKELGFKYHSTIVWNEGNISRRTAWGSWLSASAPYVIAPVELIVVLYKKRWKKLQEVENQILQEKNLWNGPMVYGHFPERVKKELGTLLPFQLSFQRDA